MHTIQIPGGRIAARTVIKIETTRDTVAPA